MSNKAAELKALRRQDDTERRRILSQLAEDKAEREQRRQAAIFPGGRHAAAPAAEARSTQAAFDEAARRERLQAMHQSKLQQEREKEAIRRRVSEDRLDRKVGAAAARLGTVRNATGAGASASGAGGVVSPPTDPHVTTSEVRVRCEDGTVLRRVFGADAPVAMVAQMVQEQRPAVAGPFVLRAGLAPRGTLLVLAEHSRGLVRRAGEEEDDSEIGQQANEEQLLAEMPVGAPPPGDAGSYEEMLEYAERVGQVSTGLSVAQDQGHTGGEAGAPRG
ncbi:hypothetical protein EMIHUDRAFT_213176 [Emiliania huxleyi CCMP1516]|uniref:UBX domain-containing protein n=2 Tax=Emiliania huxleyi TaxID=2903 RepID=A0A0D3INU1_EMIH1|nr:hypothetical protein EMIHUDRAFT_213176 [Emiliania huxleyi CCMP1516]EOD12926.1 hypothetical protein EMIHUDRAFT_213176 [Emiliania huxleyi CCMP1516]|eukprot:XP_005765355.1 hypothetical protein EMIHUDRAFT_213176 [Emiliania huxleyi CCMP1516]